MSLSIYTAAERPDLEDVTVPSRDIWPKYNIHGDVVNPNWGALWFELTEFQLFITDDDTGAVVAELNTGPLWWDGADENRGFAYMSVRAGGLRKRFPSRCVFRGHSQSGNCGPACSSL